MNATDRYKTQRADGQKAWDLLVKIIGERMQFTREEYDAEYQRLHGEQLGGAREPGSMGRRRTQAIQRYRRYIERQEQLATTEEEALAWRLRALVWVPTARNVTGPGYYKIFGELLPIEYETFARRWKRQIDSLVTKLEQYERDFAANESRKKIAR